MTVVIEGKADGARWAFGRQSDFDPESGTLLEREWRLGVLWDVEVDWIGQECLITGRSLADAYPLDISFCRVGVSERGY